jgi:uncharacterized integral membrane protein
MADDQHQHTPASKRRSPAVWVGVAAAIVALIFIAQNSQSVQVDFIFAETETPLFWALLISAALGALAGWLIPKLRRRDR